METRRHRLHVHATPEQVKEALVREGGTLCLDSALEAYSSYFRPGRVCAYTTESPRIVDGLRPAMGGLLPVHLYEPDLPLDDDTEDGHTKRFRTLLDLICDGKTYAAKDLFQQLWGIEVGEAPFQAQGELFRAKEGLGSGTR